MDRAYHRALDVIRCEAYAGVQMPRNNPLTPAAQRNQVRIIGGSWRGRKLHFPNVPGLRPTPDRVRETLFNWLQFEIPGRRCLDLYAGSGALGLEALSRGASEVVFVETDPDAARAVATTLQLLQCNRGRVARLDAEAFLAQPAEPFDIIFLDPPFALRVLPKLCEAIERGGWLTPGGWVYLEGAAAEGPPSLPDGWTMLRSKKAGEVGYHLARRP